MKCPKCGSEHVQFVTSTETTGISGLDSCCGFLLMGPIGLLCGLCGSGYSTTSEYWVCHECGAKFQARDVQEAQQRRQTDIERLAECNTLLASLPDNLAEEYEQVSKQLAEVSQQYSERRKQLCQDHPQYKRNGRIGEVMLLVAIVGIVATIVSFLEDSMLIVPSFIVAAIGIVATYQLSRRADRLFGSYADSSLKELRIQKEHLSQLEIDLKEKLKVLNDAKKDKARIEQELHQDRSKDE